MERAGRIVARWNTSGGDCVSTETLVTAAWRVAVGKRIAARTIGLRLVRKHLIVRVEDDVWRRQLFSLRHQILANLSRALGQNFVEDLEFRLGERRIGPAREERLRRKTSSEAVVADEAERIEDPLLRAIYKRARQQA